MKKVLYATQVMYLMEKDTPKGFVYLSYKDEDGKTIIWENPLKVKKEDVFPYSKENISVTNFYNALLTEIKPLVEIKYTDETKFYDKVIRLWKESIKNNDLENFKVFIEKEILSITKKFNNRTGLITSLIRASRQSRKKLLDLSNKIRQGLPS